MKVIVAGSRTIYDYAVVKDAIEKSGFEITELVSGGARGVDRLGERYAEENSIPTKVFIPKWDKYGKRAGYLRNEMMANYADACIMVWNGFSLGSRMMFELAQQKGIKLFNVIVKKNDIQPE
jgi:hypothetical protein